MKEVRTQIMYIELKTGYSDDGPAWIGKVKLSKSGRTVYFLGKGFKRVQGISGNFVDIETGEEYWISGVKKNGRDRHWAGSGKIEIDKKIIGDYLKITGQKAIDPRRLEIVEIVDNYPVEKINSIENQKANRD